MATTRSKRISLSLGMIFLFCCLSNVAAADNSAYLEILRLQARTLNLASTPTWLNLLHYKQHPLSGRNRSLADDPHFFTATDGATQPQAELDATLASFFTITPETDLSQPAQCRYIARFVWLQEQLQFDERMPRAVCTRFKVWRDAINPGGVTLIYASAYLNSPASMYGHTMFRVDQPDQTSPTLAYTLSYAANGHASDGLGFVYKGLTGLYPGLFSSSPYYLRVREYSDLENRDVWEYQLNLTQPEIEMMLRHAWELGSVRFDYFFFDENCSYHILSLLDVARPSLQLTDQFVWSTIPIDTVKAALAIPGLVSRVQYRPSQRSLLDAHMQTLNSQQAGLAREISWGNVAVTRLDPQVVAPRQGAEIIDLADLYLSYLGIAKRMDGHTVAQRLHELRVARSQYPVVPEVVPATPAVRPDQGHASGRLTTGIGRQQQRSFIEIGYRPALHDLLDPEPGYIRGAQIEFLDVAARAYQHGGIRLERLTAVNIISLAPRDTLFTPKSWRVRVGREQVDTAAARRSSNTLAGSAGMAWDVRTDVLAYGFVDLRADYVPGLAEHGSAGIGGSVGVLWDSAPSWRVISDFALMRNSNDALGTQRLYKLASRWTLNPDYALTLHATHLDAQMRDNTWQLQLRRYF
jgi:hypothetical protein